MLYTMKHAAVLGAFFTLLAAVPAVSAALAQDNAERLAAADRLIAVQQPEQMLQDMAKSVASNLPEPMRDSYISAMTEEAFVEGLSERMRDAMARHFTVAELDALAEFYARPVAKSVMRKMGAYTADVMPWVQERAREQAMKMIRQMQDNQ
jgi:hypothetical protein